MEFLASFFYVFIHQIIIDLAVLGEVFYALAQVPCGTHLAEYALHAVPLMQCGSLLDMYC